MCHTGIQHSFAILVSPAALHSELRRPRDCFGHIAANLAQPSRKFRKSECHDQYRLIPYGDTEIPLSDDVEASARSADWSHAANVVIRNGRSETK